MAAQNLSPWESRAYAAIERAANDGARFPTADDLIEAIGCESHASTVNVVNRLEQRGLIVVERFQRERVGTIVATGKRTAEPRTRSQHWRAATIPEPLKVIQRRDPELFRELLVAGRCHRAGQAQFLAKLIEAGWRLIQSAEVKG